MKLSKPKPKPSIGATRTFKSFAIVPIKVFDRETKSYEWIWLHKYTLNQVYRTDWSTVNAENRWMTDVRYI